MHVALMPNALKEFLEMRLYIRHCIRAIVRSAAALPQGILANTIPALMAASTAMLCSVETWHWNAIKRMILPANSYFLPAITSKEKMRRRHLGRALSLDSVLLALYGCIS